jgi:hypothetical protein
MPLRFDICQVVARGFHIKGWDLLAQYILGKAFNGGVAPAVKDQAFLNAEKAAGIRPQSQILAPSRSVLSHTLASVFI